VSTKSRGACAATTASWMRSARSPEKPRPASPRSPPHSGAGRCVHGACAGASLPSGCLGVGVHSVWIHQVSQGSYGVLRVQAELAAQGMPWGHRRVARLMRRARLVGCHHRPRVGSPRVHGCASRPDMGRRQSSLPTEQESLRSLAVLLEVCRRRVVGWSLQAQLRHIHKIPTRA